MATPDKIDSTPEQHRKNTFHFENVTIDKRANTTLRVMMVNNVGDHVPVQFACDTTPINTDIGIIYAALVLLGLYIMIIWEVKLMFVFFPVVRFISILYSLTGGTSNICCNDCRNNCNWYTRCNE